MKLALASSLLLAALAPVAQADDFNRAGTWSVGVGAHQVDPDTDRGASFSNSVRPSISGEYFFRDNWGVALDVVAPSKHDIGADGFGRVASTKVFMPTASVKYHFETNSKFRPYVGLGVAYVDFSDTHFDANTGLGGLGVKISDRFAPAATVGLDYRVGQNGAIRADVRYVDVRSPRVRVAGVDAGRLEFDSLVYGVQYVHQF